MELQNYDLGTAQGKQEFQQWVTALIRNEVNAYIQEVLFTRDTTYIDSGTTGLPLSDTDRIIRLEQATFRR